MEQAHASRCGIEARLPYRDRRLVELALALPAHQLYASGNYKVVARNAMKGLLPERVRACALNPPCWRPLFRKGLADKESAIARAVIDRPDALAHAFLDPAWLARARPGRDGLENRRPGRIWLCVAIEL